MFMEYLENTLQLTVIITMQVYCLFQYIRYRDRGYIYMIAFFLSSLVSSYYWTVYLLIMGESPNTADILSYLGWNIGFAVILLLIIHMKTSEERRYFHPLMLLPIPLNIFQLTLYLPFGGELNSIYQVTVMTGIAVFSIQSICWYWKNKGSTNVPYTAISTLLYAACEFGMWTVSCFDFPSLPIHPYYIGSILCSLVNLFMAWAVNRDCSAKADRNTGETGNPQQKLLRAIYLAVVLLSCLGGLALAVWIKNKLIAGTDGSSGTSVFDIIPVVLFVCSLIIVAFAIAIILLVNFGQKAAESDALREAKQAAERANAAKSDFLANMSHEIRTPINAMLGMNEIILRESLKARDLLPRDREMIRAVFSDICIYAGNIDSAGKSLLSIINDILDFSRIENGRLEIVSTPYKLSSVLNDVSNMILFKAKAKGLDFQVDVDETIPDILNGDEVRIRQVITNLLNNAVKYTDNGKICLTIKTGSGVRKEGESLNLVICVEDTGVGIREEDIGRLFNKFERMDLEHNSTVEGTGLGLAITQHLLELMDGKISVQSEYGKGSVFTVTLPQIVVSTEPVGNFKEKFEKNIQTAKSGGDRFQAPGTHILIVDDTRMNLTVAAGLLKNTEIEIDAVTGGEEAVRLTQTIHYDLILMDQRMPIMDGTETLHRIRAQEDGANRETPVICLTADAVSGARERYIAQGFTDYLTKPIDSGALERMLKKYLPADNIILQSAEAALQFEAASEPAGDLLSSLSTTGLDTGSGLAYCRGDKEFYRSLLKEFVQSADEKMDCIRACYESEDWKNYGILVHSVKSTSKMIGAKKLSASAAFLEAAADSLQKGEIHAGHGEMMKEYAFLAEAINRVTCTEKSVLQETADGDDILEFLPE